MPEKVTVDILEIEEPLSGEGIPPEEEASPEKWQLGKLLIAGLITAVIFSAGGYVLWTNLSAPPGANEAPPVQTIAAPAPESAPAAEAAAPLRPAPLRATEIEGFIVDLQDEKGNPRVVLCGFALDAEGREASLLDRDVDLRRIIYESLRSHRVESLMTSEGKNALKKEIRELLEKRAGAPPIRDVYFTKFVVL